MAGGPKVAILGAGSVGCFIGGAWAAAGVPVTFIGRQKIASKLDAHGLTLSDYSGWRAHLSPGEIDYRCGPEALADADIIAVTVRSDDTADAAADIAEHGAGGSTVISLQNGVSNVDVLERGLGGRFEVVRGMVYYNIAHLGEGRFHRGVAGEVCTENHPKTRLLAEQIGEGPAALKLSNDMLAVAWGKLISNLNNAVNALSGLTLLDELQQRDYRRVLAASQREALRLLKHADIRPAKAGPVDPRLLAVASDAPDWLYRFVIKKWKLDGKSRSSMADHLAAGRKTEIDYINGEVVALAERLNLDAPINRKIVELVHKAEAGAKPLSAKALRKAVLDR